MEAFRRMIEKYSKENATIEKIDKVKAEENMNAGLSLTHDVLCEIEAKKVVIGRDFEKPENLLQNLQKYISCSLESERETLPYVTAELASYILRKLLDHFTTVKETIMSHDKTNEGNCHRKLDELIKISLQLKNLNRFQMNTFVSSVLEMRLPVVVLSALQKADMLPVSAYIFSNIDKKELIEYIINDMMFCLENDISDDISNHLYESSLHLLVSLLQFGLREEIEDPGPMSWKLCNKACRTFLDYFLTQISHHVCTKEESVSVGKYLLHLSQKKWHIGERAFQEFCNLSLFSLAVNSKVTTEHALAMHQRWVCVEIPSSLTLYLNDLMLTMGEDRALSAIISLIEEESSKWQDILIFLSAFLKCYPDGVIAIKAYVDECLTRALTKHSRPLLACVFLLARHACSLPNAVNRTAFHSYSAWFGSTFGVEGGSVLTLSNTAAFSFLMKFLTDLVPLDSPLYLRVHINKVPSAPVNCSHLLTDFVALTKTRLQDLGEATGSGLFAFENSPQKDVSVALAHFESTGGQISRVLLESSRFRQAQYENQFLPALLVAEPICEEKTVRQLLITKLQVAGKIPVSKLQQYEMACQRLTSQKTGVLKDRPVLANPLEKWQAVLQLLVETIRNDGLDEAGKLTEQGESVFTAIADQLDSLLNWVAQNSDASASYAKVVGSLFKACELCLEPPIPQGIEKSSTWLHRLLTLLKSHCVLMHQFHGEVNRIACNPLLPCHATKTAALLSCMMDMLGVGDKKLGDSVAQALQLVSKKKMLHALVFCSAYLRMVDKECTAGSLSKWSSSSLLRIFIYLRERLLYSRDPEVVELYKSSWIPPLSWKNHVSEVQLVLSEWLEMEALIDRDEDPVSEKYPYMCEWIVQHCDKPLPQLLKACITLIAKGNTTLGKELLYIIPSLPLSLDETTGNERASFDDTIPWLVETWMEMTLQFTHQEIMQAVQNLPSWMLLSNMQGRKPTSVSINALADLIDKNMEKMSEKGFLVLDVVCLLIGAARTTAPFCRTEVLSQIINACPAFHISILKNLQHLQMQLIPCFANPLSMDCNLEMIMKLLENPIRLEVTHGNYNWKIGLVWWSQEMPYSEIDYGSLFFHLLDLGVNLLNGRVAIVMVPMGNVLPSVSGMATVLVQKPMQCFNLLKDATKPIPYNLPATGISHCGRAGLALAVMSVMLSISDEHLALLGTDESLTCAQVIQQCLTFWKESCRELNCDSRVREVSFVQWLSKRVHILIERLKR